MVDRDQLIAQLQEQLPRLANAIAEQLVAEQLASYAGIPPEQLNRMATAALSSFVRDIAEDQNVYFAGYWEKIAEARAEQGSNVEDLLRAVFLSSLLLDAFVAERFPDEHALRIWWLGRLHSVINQGALTLARIFTVVRERMIRGQAAQLRELSTPIIPLHAGILALPLIGTIDADRAGQIMETLLNGITQQQAEVVLVDITGVPVVDIDVAHYLLQAARAAALIGAQMVLVGISPKIAQTLTHIGADLAHLTTCANLQAGLDYAFAQQGLKLVRQ